MEKPFVCEACGTGVAQTLRGLKKHITQVHGELAPELIARAVEAASAAAQPMPFSNLENAVKGSPDVETGAEKTSPSPTPPVGQPSKVTRQVKIINKRIGKNLSESLCRIIDIGLFREARLTEEEKDELEKSLEIVFDVFDVQFEITPIQVTLRNPLWILAFPVISILSIFMGREMGFLSNLGQESKQDAAKRDHGDHSSEGSGQDNSGLGAFQKI